MPYLFIFRFLKLHPWGRPGAKHSCGVGRGEVVGSSGEEECGPFDSSPLGAQVGADTVSAYPRTGITVKSRDEILVPLASGVKLSLTPLGPGFYSWYEFSRSDNLKMLFMRKAISPSKIPCLQFWKSLTYVLRVYHISCWETLWCQWHCGKIAPRRPQ